MCLNRSIASVTLAITPLLFASTAAGVDEPEVKLSRNHVCHERGDPYYSTTMHYQAFNTVAECVKAGGRVSPKRAGKGHESQAESGASVDGNLDQFNTKPDSSGFKWKALVSRYSSDLVVVTGFGVAIGLFLLLRSVRLRVKRRLGKPITDQPSARKYGRQSPARDSRTPPAVNMGASEVRDLVVACLGDRDAAERLIQFEIDKNPSLSWEAAARAALARIKRDNH